MWLFLGQRLGENLAHFVFFHLCLSQTYESIYLRNVINKNMITIGKGMNEEMPSFTSNDLNSALRFIVNFLKSLTDKPGLSENNPYFDLTGNIYLNICKITCEFVYLNKAINRDHYEIIGKLFSKYFSEESLMDSENYFSYKSSVSQNLESTNKDMIYSSSIKELEVELDENILKADNKTKTNVLSNSLKISEFDKEKLNYLSFKDLLLNITEDDYNGLLDHVNMYNIISGCLLKSYNSFEKLMSLYNNGSKLDDPDEIEGSGFSLKHKSSMTSTKKVNFNVFSSAKSKISDMTYNATILENNNLLTIINKLRQNLPEKLIYEIDGELIYKVNKYNDLSNPIDESIHYESVNYNKLLNFI